MPNAVLLVERVKNKLDDERKRRLHFYEIVEENKKIEFINGEIIFHSPVRLQHNRAAGLVYKLLDTFVTKHKLGFVGIEKIMVLLTRNDYEPDVCFFGSEKAKSFKRRQAQFPAPDFVVEVLSGLTAKNDRETKFQDYAAHGVREYWIIDPEKETVEQYILQGEEYELLLKAKSGEIEGVAVVNFKIPVRAIFDETENLRALANIISE